MTIVTKTGDGGLTSIKGIRVSKTDAVIEALGVIDETNAWIGTHLVSKYTSKIQCFLFDLGSIVAKYSDKDVPDKLLTLIEKETKDIESILPVQKYFILPRNKLHIVRANVRKCERAVLNAIDPHKFPVCAKTLNRLSDYIFILAREYEEAPLYTITNRDGFHKVLTEQDLN